MFIKIFILISLGLFNTANMLMSIWREFTRIITIMSAALTSNMRILLTSVHCGFSHMQNQSGGRWVLALIWWSNNAFPHMPPAGLSDELWNSRTVAEAKQQHLMAT